jgi:hypothetical protein
MLSVVDRGLYRQLAALSRLAAATDVLTAAAQA